MRLQLLPTASTILALVLACISLAPFLDIWLDRLSTLQSAEERLTELRAKRLDPRLAESFRQEMAAETDPSGGYIADSGDTEIASRLREIIGAASRLHGAELVEVSSESRTMEGGEPIVRASIKIAVGNDEVGPVIRALEFGSPAVFFEHLHISEEPPVGVGNESPMLNLVATIVMYRETRTRGKSGT
jgi:hypothetical protein